MKRLPSNAGYSMVELMIAITISTIIIASIGASLIAAMRMMSMAMAETEFTLATRELRDKLLFHISPDSGNCHSAGLWSMTNSASMIEGNTKIFAQATVVGTSLANETQQSAQLLINEYQGGWGFCNDSDRSHLDWLRPGKIPLAKNFASSVRVSETGTNKRGQTYPRRFHVEISYLYHPSYLPQNITTFDVSRSETIVVPVLGKIHRWAFPMNHQEANL